MMSLPFKRQAHHFTTSLVHLLQCCQPAAVYY